MHFMLECPAYCHIHAQYPSILGGPDLSVQTDSPVKRMVGIFACRQQDDLAAYMHLLTEPT
jgi:hypothetical protein